MFAILYNRICKIRDKIGIWGKKYVEYCQTKGKSLISGLRKGENCPTNSMLHFITVLLLELIEYMFDS